MLVLVSRCTETDKPELLQNLRLFARADFHVGAKTTRFVKLKIRLKYQYLLVPAPNQPPAPAGASGGGGGGGNSSGGAGSGASAVAGAVAGAAGGAVGVAAAASAHKAKMIVVQQPGQGQRSLSLCGTLDGALNYLVPIDEAVYRRLYSLHTQMTFNLPHVAGLNPRAFRYVCVMMPTRLAVVDLLKT